MGIRVLNLTDGKITIVLNVDDAEDLRADLVVDVRHRSEIADRLNQALHDVTTYGMGSSAR